MQSPPRTTSILHSILLVCTLSAIAFTPLGIASRAAAQGPTTGLSFEVATIKPVLIDSTHRFNPRHFWAHITPAGASYWSMTPLSLLGYAYEIQSYQVAGPDWANADHFDIEARFPEGADKKNERKMLQTLLKDRFQLAFHIEQRQLEGYALVVSKRGAKLKPSPADPPPPAAPDPPKPSDTNTAAAPAKSTVTKNPDGSSTINMGKRGTQTIRYNQENSAMQYERSKITMEELASMLRNCLNTGDHRIVDETGIQGNFQLTYDCPMRSAQSPSAGANGLLPSDPQGRSALTESLDALGLRLESRRMLQDVYVIDRIEKPTEN